MHFLRSDAQGEKQGGVQYQTEWDVVEMLCRQLLMPLVEREIWKPPVRRWQVKLWELISSLGRCAE